ncbi:PEP-CTERM sorting domain-containing protein [Paludisphaera rhizosphaerae]|uniref:PEP-CTERM sorting domain-containing protein n=1 Tax=Paludisphaera rhizosphaerae TaxID=2711216 RepID=UPI0013EBF600|nr:PEP-CTERM sorting domain-containing protein [Paludisphaera rhizosphaerae]
MIRHLLASAALLVLAAAGSAHAASFTYSLDISVNGAAPLGLATATIADAGANTVQITMDLTGMPTGQFVDSWLFNFDGTQSALNALTFTYNAGLSTGASAGTPGTTLNAYGNNNTSGFGNNSSGLMDIYFNFPTPQGNRFNGGEKVVYDVTGTGVTASMFNVTSAPNYNANGPYYTAAHIAGIADGSSTTSGAIGANSVGSVPEPASVVLGLMGAMGIGAIAFRRRHATI